jgi:methylase of polypeptide subunit release factors
VLGLFVGMHNPDVRRIYLADWLLTPLAFAWLSVCLNAPKLRGRTVTCLLGMQTSWIECPDAVGRFDLCVCNPPYLPIFEDFPQMRLTHTVAGTDLLEHVIEHASDIATRTYISFSDVAIDEATRAAARGNRVLRRVGDGHIIPFTVPQAFQSSEYVERLYREKKIVERDHDEFRWWHTVRTYCIEGN